MVFSSGFFLVCLSKPQTLRKGTFSSMLYFLQINLTIAKIDLPLAFFFMRWWCMRHCSGVLWQFKFSESCLKTLELLLEFFVTKRSLFSRMNLIYISSSSRLHLPYKWLSYFWFSFRGILGCSCSKPSKNPQEYSESVNCSWSTNECL